MAVVARYPPFMKSHAIVFTGPRQAEWIEEDVADPGPGEVTVETIVSHLSTGTESWCYRGEFDSGTNWESWVQYPFYPGYSNVARVIKVGADVTNLCEGDRVWTATPHRQFANVKANRPGTIKLPETTCAEDAAWCALSYVSQTAVRRAEHAMGDTAVVIGLGPLGQLVTQYLRVAGLREVLVIDVAEKRLELARAHGATQWFCGSAADAGDFVRAHTEGRLADVIYDVTGHYAVFPSALGLAREFGAVILLGDSPHPSRQHLTQDVMARQVKVIGTHGARLPPEHSYWTAPRQAQLFLEYIHRGQMVVSDLVTDRFRPSDAPKVYRELQNDRGATMGILYDWSDASE